MEPAVAKVAEDLKGEEVAGCLGEEVEVASYPLEVAADLQQKHVSLGWFVFFILQIFYSKALGAFLIQQTLRRFFAFDLFNIGKSLQ